MSRSGYTDDCETCDRKQVPCKSCDESQRAICYRCNGDVDDPYCEIEGVTDNGISTTPMSIAQKIARDIRLGIFPRKSNDD